MNESRGAVPPTTTLPETLRKITETLAAELACPTQRAPDWSDFEWKIARAVAAMHGVSPQIALREHSAKSDAWASQNQWARLSQVRRIVRWVTSRPRRAVTMHAVSAALRCAQ